MKLFLLMRARSDAESRELKKEEDIIRKVWHTFMHCCQWMYGSFSLSRRRKRCWVLSGVGKMKQCKNERENKECCFCDGTALTLRRPHFESEISVMIITF